MFSGIYRGMIENTSNNWFSGIFHDSTSKTCLEHSKATEIDKKKTRMNWKHSRIKLAEKTLNEINSCAFLQFQITILKIQPTHFAILTDLSEDSLCFLFSVFSMLEKRVFWRKSFQKYLEKYRYKCECDRRLFTVFCVAIQFPNWIEVKSRECWHYQLYTAKQQFQVQSIPIQWMDVLVHLRAVISVYWFMAWLVWALLRRSSMLKYLEIRFSQFYDNLRLYSCPLHPCHWLFFQFLTFTVLINIVHLWSFINFNRLTWHFLQIFF